MWQTCVLNDFPPKYLWVTAFAFSAKLLAHIRLGEHYSVQARVFVETCAIPSQNNFLCLRSDVWWVKT